MTTAELAEKVWWSAAKRFPWRSWRFSGTTGYRVLVIKDETHALVERVVKHKGWRKVALQPREVRQAVKRLRGIRRLSARSKTAVGTLSESLEHSRRTRVCLVQDGTDRQ